MRIMIGKNTKDFYGENTMSKRAKLTVRPHPVPIGNRPRSTANPKLIL